MAKLSRAALAAYTLNPMPPRIKNSMLRDDEFCKRIQFKPSFSYPITESISLSTTSWLDAVVAAMAGRKTFTLKAVGNKSYKAKLSRQNDGSVTVAFERHIINIKDADVTASSKNKRSAALKRIFDQRPLSREDEEGWLKASSKRAFTNEDLVELMTASGATPEALHLELGHPQNLTIDSLVPNERGYYERLLAPWRGDNSPADFIETGLKDNRRWLLAHHRSVGLRRIAYSALLHPLIPFDLLSDVKQKELEGLLGANDPFSLLFGFEVVRRLVVKNPKYVPLGTRFLDRLFSDETKTKAHLTVFCACAIASVVKLRLIFEEGSVPLFWFRLAALTHAGVVTDALAAPSRPKDFLQWVSQQVGPEYAWHTVVDLREAPRWEPDWISPDQLYCELLGRSYGAIQLPPDAERPAEWLDKLTLEIKKQTTNRSVSPFFPGPLEDFVEPAQRVRDPAFLDAEEKIKSAKTIDEVKGFSGLVYLDRPSPDLATEIARILEASRATLLEASDKTLAFLHNAAKLAAMVRSLPLANAVIDESVRLSRIENTPLKRSIEMVQVALAACAAASAQNKHRALVGETCSKFAYTLSGKPDANIQLVAMFDALSRRDAKLLAALGRAAAVTEAAALRKRP